jgi:hypothetical protein
VPVWSGAGADGSSNGSVPSSEERIAGEKPMNRLRQSHEGPAAVARLGWRYHHIGIPHSDVRAEEQHLESLGIHVCGFETSPYGVEWIRFDAHCAVPDIVKMVPHVAFEVDDLAEALRGRDVLIAPNAPSAGVQVAFILDDGAPIELMEFAKAPANCRGNTKAELKTRPTGASVRGYLGAIEDPQRRADCRAIAAIMRRVTTHAPKMWGPGIVGFGRYHYRYATGREGDMCLVGFSSRRPDISIYLAPGLGNREALLRALGKHRTGKGCLHVRRLADIDLRILERLIRESVAELRRRHPGQRPR